MLGSDYNLDNAQIIIPVGSVEDELFCASITIFEDDAFELDEVFTVTATIEDTSFFVQFSGNRNMQDYTITDNDG